MPYIGKSPTGSGVRQRYHYTATGGETSLSGADDNSKTLKFTDGEYVDVYLNGVLLVQGTDYGVGTANTISSLAALAANDIVEVIVYDIYNVAKINSEAVRSRHYFTATGGETSIGTSQISGLSFPANADIDVKLNGVTLVAGTDYNTTTANTVGGLTALTAGQVVEIVIYEKFQLADTVSKASGGTFNGPVTFNGDLNAGTIKDATGANTAITIDSNGNTTLNSLEYFAVELTTSMTSLADNSINVIDFGGKGTVKYDTKSNFDSTNDCYLFDSDGVYLITYGVGFGAGDGNDVGFRHSHVSLEVSTDNGTTYTGLTGQASRPYDDGSQDERSQSFAGSFVYKSTNSTNKVRLQAQLNTDGVTYTIAHRIGLLTSSSPSIDPSPTYLTVVRIG